MIWSIKIKFVSLQQKSIKQSNYEDIEELFMGYAITNDKDNYRLILKRDISTIINTYREIREFYEKKGYVCQEGKI